MQSVTLFKDSEIPTEHLLSLMRDPDTCLEEPLILTVTATQIQMRWALLKSSALLPAVRAMSQSQDDDERNDGAH